MQNKDKLKVWVIQTGEPVYGDGEFVRPMRAMNLCNKLIEKGHEVVLWTTAFDHTNKKHRSVSFQTKSIKKNLTLNLIPSPGYLSHKSLSRLYDHYLLAKNFKKILNSEIINKPDVAFVGFPPIELAYVATNWLKLNNIPSIIDVKDQWPDAFIEHSPFPKILRPFLRLVFYPYRYLTKRTLLNSTIFCSMSESYLQWMSNTSNRELNNKDIIAPLTTPSFSGLSVDSNSERDWWKDKGVDLTNDKRFHFIGSLSPSFDFSMIRDVALKFMDEKVDCQFVICGDGSEFKQTKETMKGLSNVIFPGWINSRQAQALCSSSRGSLAPYVNSGNFVDNIPNKILDSLSSSLPIITTLQGEVENILKKYEAGYSVKSSFEMESKMLLLLNDDIHYQSMGQNAYSLYNENFSYDKIYSKITNSLIDLVGK